MLSVVVPVHDEEGSIGPLYAEIDAAVRGFEGEVELVFVDDGSRDASRDRMLEIQARDPRVRVLALDRRHGQSAALDAGFRAAGGDVVVTLDADLQNDPADIPRLLAHLEGADVVQGVRQGRRDDWLRRISSRIANAVRRRVVGDRVTDIGCSIRAVRSPFLARVRMYDHMHRFLPALLQMEGARLVEVPVAHRERRHGRSKYGLRNRLAAGIVDVLAVRWMQRRALHYSVDELGPRRRST